MPRPRFSSILFLPKKRYFLQGRKKTPQQNLKGHARLLVFLWLLLGSASKKKVYITIVVQQVFFFRRFFAASVFQVVCGLLLVLLKMQEPQNTEMVDFLVRTLIGVFNGGL